MHGILGSLLLWADKAEGLIIVEMFVERRVVFVLEKADIIIDPIPSDLLTALAG